MPIADPVCYSSVSSACGLQSHLLSHDCGQQTGDPISPNTFIAFLERIMDGINEMEDKGVIIQELPIYNLKFADDVDLIDSDPDNLQAMLNKLCEDSERYGMCINKDKTKAMTFWRSVQSDELTLSIHGTQVEYICTELYMPRKHDILK